MIEITITNILENGDKVILHESHHSKFFDLWGLQKYIQNKNCEAHNMEVDSINEKVYKMKFTAFEREINTETIEEEILSIVEHDVDTLDEIKREIINHTYGTFLNNGYADFILRIIDCRDIEDIALTLNAFNEKTDLRFWTFLFPQVTNEYGDLLRTKRLMRRYHNRRRN